MIYKKIQVELNHPLSFWKFFENEERIFFYNPIKKEYILGAKRLNSFPLEEEMNHEFLYIFTSMTFFDSIKDDKWKGLGNEKIGYQYYLVIKKGIQTLYYIKDLVEIKNYEIKKFKHFFQYGKEDYENWENLFSTMNKKISAKEANKVVISREVKIECDTTINVESVLLNLIEKNKNSFSTSINDRKNSICISATIKFS